MGDHDVAKGDACVAIIGYGNPNITGGSICKRLQGPLDLYSHWSARGAEKLVGKLISEPILKAPGEPIRPLLIRLHCRQIRESFAGKREQPLLLVSPGYKVKRHASRDCLGSGKL